MKITKNSEEKIYLGKGLIYRWGHMMMTMMIFLRNGQINITFV